MGADLTPLMHDPDLVEQAQQLRDAHQRAIDDVCPDGDRPVEVDAEEEWRAEP